LSCGTGAGPVFCADAAPAKANGAAAMASHSLDARNARGDRSGVWEIKFIAKLLQAKFAGDAFHARNGILPTLRTMHPRPALPPFKKWSIE
jgi:hypothetical protein